MQRSDQLPVFALEQSLRMVALVASSFALGSVGRVPSWSAATSVLGYAASRPINR